MGTWRTRTAEQWVQALGDGEPAARDSVPNLGAITLLSSQIEAEHARHARRLRLRRASFVATASVLGVAAGAALWLRSAAPSETPALAEVRAFEHGVSLEGAPHEARLSVGTQLAAGDTLVTGAAASAALAVSDGGTLRLSAFSELRLIGAADVQRLGGARLGRGSVEVDLPKQRPGEQFSVSTPDSRVTVVGTRFNVRVAEGPDGPVTCVSVSHGRVRVESAERQALLEAGQRWVSRGELAACDGARAPTSTGISTPSESGVAETPAVVPARRAGAGGALAGEPRPGTLAEENRLFLELVRARRDGRSEEARSLQRKFMTRYPGSVLAAQVREEQRKTQ